MQPTATTPDPILAQPAPGSEPALLIAYYRQRAQRAIANFGSKPQEYSSRPPYLLVEPENVLAMLGDGQQPTDREKLLVANRENEQNKLAAAELARITQMLGSRPIFDDCETTCDKVAKALREGAKLSKIQQQVRDEQHRYYHLLKRLERLVFITAPSHGKGDTLHDGLSAIVKEFATDYGEPAPGTATVATQVLQQILFHGHPNEENKAILKELLNHE